MTGSAFVRLLAALNDIDTPAPKDDFAARLSRWVDWRDAMPLSAALGAAPASPPPLSPPPFRRGGALSPAHLQARECERVREGLLQLIEQATQREAPPRRATPGQATPPAGSRLAKALEAETSGDFSLHKLQYVTVQQSMEARLATLRERVRGALATSGPAEMARLAALDEVMADVVGAQERTLLASVPRWLEQRFKHLQQQAAPAEPTADEPAMDAPPPFTAWQDGFLQDMRALLLAELELRMQPIEGLLAALRSTSSGGASPEHP